MSKYQYALGRLKEFSAGSDYDPTQFFPVYPSGAKVSYARGTKPKAVWEDIRRRDPKKHDELYRHGLARNAEHRANYAFMLGMLKRKMAETRAVGNK